MSHYHRITFFVLASIFYVCGSVTPSLDPETWGEEYSEWTNCTRNETHSPGCGEVGVISRYKKDCFNTTNNNQKLDGCLNQPFEVQNCSLCCIDYCENITLGGWSKCKYFENNGVCGNGYRLQKKQCRSHWNELKKDWLCNRSIVYNVEDCHRPCEDACDKVEIKNEEISFAKILNQRGQPEKFLANVSTQGGVYLQKIRIPPNGFPGKVDYIWQTALEIEDNSNSTEKDGSIVFDVPMPVSQIASYDEVDHMEISYCEIPNYQPWGEWSLCVGERCGMTIPVNRTRECQYRSKLTAPSKKCFGKSMSHQLCKNSSCYRLTPWTNGSCIGDCGIGTRNVTRTCMAVFKDHIHEDLSQCNTEEYKRVKPCHVGTPCYEFSPWSQWVFCNVSLPIENGIAGGTTPSFGNSYYPKNNNLDYNVTNNVNNTVLSQNKTHEQNSETNPDYNVTNSTVSSQSKSHDQYMVCWKRYRKCLADGTPTSLRFCDGHQLEKVNVTEDISECSATCGQGIKTRNVSCILNPVSNANISSPICENFTKIEDIPCNIENCPVFEIRNATNWTECSVTCDRGFSYLHQTCNVIKNGSVVDWKNCADLHPEPMKFHKSCRSVNCSDVFEIRSKSNWSTCSATCQGGKQSLERHCYNTVVNKTSDWMNCLKYVIGYESSTGISPPKSTTTASTTTTTTSKPRLNNESDEDDDEDETSQASSQSSTSFVSSKQTTVTNTKTVVSNRSQSSNQSMYKDQILWRECNQNLSCHPYFVKTLQLADCNVTCGDGFIPMKRYCFSINVMTEVNWTFCNSNLSVHYWKPCSSERYCGKVDGEWQKWGEWGACAATCGNTTRSRTRSCSNSTHFYLESLCKEDASSDCFKKISRDYQPCYNGPCNTSLTWGFGTWANWGECSKPCGYGVHERWRECHPYEYHFLCQPQYVVQKEVEECKVQNCLKHGGWSEWAAWTTCSKQCGLNRWKTRSRSCSNPIPSENARPCAGIKVEQTNCTLKHCPVDGKWSEWSEWKPCNKTCGGGWSHRKRQCYFPPLAIRGRDCIGNSTERISCNEHACKGGSVVVRMYAEKEFCDPNYQDATFGQTSRRLLEKRLLDYIVKSTGIPASRIKDVQFNGCSNVAKIDEYPKKNRR